MPAVNGVSGSPTHIAYLLHMALLRARTDGQPLADANAVPFTGADRLTAAHFRVLDQLPPEGIRASELAARTRITKQALGQLASQLGHRGFVETVPDPDDGRAKLLRCTPSGARATEQARQVVAAVEQGWRDQVGTERYEVFRDVLLELTGTDRDSAPRSR